MRNIEGSQKERTEERSNGSALDKGKLGEKKRDKKKVFAGGGLLSPAEGSRKRPRAASLPGGRGGVGNAGAGVGVF